MNLKSYAAAAALLGLLAAQPAHAQAYTEAEMAMLFERHAGPYLSAISMAALGERCGLLKESFGNNAWMYYKTAKTHLADRIFDYSWHNLRGYGVDHTLPWLAAEERGAAMATPERYATLRADPEALLDLKELLLAYWH